MAINKKAKGDAGSNFFASNLQRTQEHLVELQGREGSVRYRQMSRGDGQVGMILRVHKNPIKSASWSFPKPDDATPDEETAIDLLNNYFFEYSETDFDTLLSQMLSMLEYGYSLFEQIYKLYDYEGNKYFVPKLLQRMQTSIEEIFPDKRYIRQVTAVNGTVEIPFEDLVFFILNQQGEDMRGEAIIRNAYPSWKDKKVYEQWLGIGIQRSAGGVPWMKIPRGTDVEGREYQAAKDLLENLTIHENAYFIYHEGYEFGITESKFNAEQIQKAIDSKNSEMAMSVLAQWVLLGQGGRGGSFALSRDQSDFFLDGLNYVVSLIEKSFHRQVIIPFVKINFGDKIDCSRILLKGVNLNKKVGDELSDVLTKLHMTGFMKPTVDDEIFLRECLDMPELSEEEVQNRRDQADRQQEMQENMDLETQSLEREMDETEEGESDPEDKTKDKPKGNKYVKLSENAKVARKRRGDYIERTEVEVIDFMKANLMLVKDKMLADVEATLRRGVVEIQGLKNIEVSWTKYQKSLERKLSGIAVDAWNEAKRSVKTNNVKFTDADPNDIVSKAIKAFVLNQASSISEQQVANMKNQAILTASNSILKGFSIEQSMNKVNKTLEEFLISNSINVSGSLVTVGTFNFGEMQFFKEVEDQIWGYRFVNSDPVSAICKWYNGKTFSVNSPELMEATAPLHPNCKSYMEPIYKSEKKPAIDDVIAPPSIREQKVFQ